MPAFSQHERHLKSHEQIHHGELTTLIIHFPFCSPFCLCSGLDRLSAFIQSCKQDPTQYNPQKMRECLDSFRYFFIFPFMRLADSLSSHYLGKYCIVTSTKKLPTSELRIWRSTGSLKKSTALLCNFAFRVPLNAFLRLSIFVGIRTFANELHVTFDRTLVWEWGAPMVSL